MPGGMPISNREQPYAKGQCTLTGFARGSTWDMQIRNVHHTYSILVTIPTVTFGTARTFSPISRIPLGVQFIYGAAGGDRDE